MANQKQNFSSIQSLTMTFCESLDNVGINGDVKVNQIGRLFTETMYNGKYHFSQIDKPIYWAFGNADFNITLCTNGNSVELFNIAVTEKGKGLGTVVLNHLLDAADKCKIRINLNAVPTLLTGFLEQYHLNNKAAGADKFIDINEDLTIATDRLVEYYETLGFQTFGKKFQMIYVPQKCS
jgi:GNAT superfamily N-acetyltransferase